MYGNSDILLKYLLLWSQLVWNNNDSKQINTQVLFSGGPTLLKYCKNQCVVALKLLLYYKLIADIMLAFFSVSVLVFVWEPDLLQNGRSRGTNLMKRQRFRHKKWMDIL